MNHLHLQLWGEENFAEIGKKCDISFEAVGVMPIFKHAVKNGKKVYEGSAQGASIKIESVFTDKLIEAGGTLLYKFIGPSYSTSIWSWSDSVVELSWNGGSSYISIKVISLREKLVTDLVEFCKVQLSPPKTKGQVYAIVMQNGRLAMSSLGDASIPLVRHNYTDKVIEDFDFIKKDLISTYPSGRLVIMEGAPGTGKTHLVRALLDDVKRGMFVLVGPDMIKSMGGPELLPLLMQYHNYTPGPIILIIEDADKCLVSRAEKDTDTSIIQSILNLGDGILGSMLDIRIIATTNASTFQMDAAILREGRLSRHLQVGVLDQKSVLVCWNNLLPEIELPEALTGDEISLAKVYSVARKHGWKPVEPPVSYAEEDEFELDDDEDDED